MEMILFFRSARDFLRLLRFAYGRNSKQDHCNQE
jgi:hypothetical protein